jgi:hypothetical protein
MLSAKLPNLLSISWTTSISDGELKRLRAGDAAAEAEGLGEALVLLPKRVFRAGESALTEEEALKGDFVEDALLL